jgi:hypothetical protein
MRLFLIFSLTALIIFSSTFQIYPAEIYKWVDNNGVVHFTDDPGTIPEKYRLQTKKLGWWEEKPEQSIETKEETLNGAKEKAEDKPIVKKATPKAQSPSSLQKNPSQPSSQAVRAINPISPQSNSPKPYTAPPAIQKESQMSKPADTSGSSVKSPSTRQSYQSPGSYPAMVPTEPSGSTNKFYQDPESYPARMRSGESDSSRKLYQNPHGYNPKR